MNRSRLATLAAAAAVALTLSAPAPAHAAPSAFVTGTFQGVTSNQSVAFVAINGSGSRSGGYLTETFTSGDGARTVLNAVVTCAEVDGNVATIGFRIVRAEDPLFGYFDAGMVGTFFVQDNGAQGDLYAFGGVGFGHPIDCSTSAAPSFPISSGDITVR